MSDDNKKTLVITGVVTLSFPHLDIPQQPQEGQAGKPKYSAALVIPDGADLTPYQAAILTAAEAKWPGKATAMFQSGALKSPLRRDVEEKKYKNAVAFLNVRSEQKPGCVYPHADPATPGKPAKVPDDKIKEVFYAGAKVKASLRAYAYDKAGNRGVSFALNNIQKIAEGERLDNRVAAEDEFTADLNAAPADLSAIL